MGRGLRVHINALRHSGVIDDTSIPRAAMAWTSAQTPNFSLIQQLYNAASQVFTV